MLAREANVSLGTIQRWEAGKLPPVRELIRLAGILAVEVDQLVEDFGADGADLATAQDVRDIKESLKEIKSRLPDPEQLGALIERFDQIATTLAAAAATRDQSH